MAEHAQRLVYSVISLMPSVYTVVVTGIAEATTAAGQASGFGTARGRVFGNDGEDTITISETSKGPRNTSGGGAVSAFIDGGMGNDTLTIQYSIDC